ncbi:MAG TPA: MFS transporter, partial [Candidatus Acidoferrum sp.]|nr:MFS transporter [Candidatus Acidoferrum sp.]
MDDDLKKDEGTLDNEAQKKLSEQPLSSSKSTLPETSEKIRISAWITLAILGSTVLITMYGETMLLPAIRDIIKDFDISYTTSSWILTAYLISGAVATPIAGKLSDIYGRKKMVVIILIIYIIGISAGGLSTNISFLLIARVIQGIGISIFPIAFGIIRDQLPKDKLAIGVGVFSSMFAAGAVVGLAVGGSIINNFGWHATFLSIVPIAIILWVIINRFIHGDKSAEAVEKEGNLAQADVNTKASKVHTSNPGGVGFNSNGMRSLDVKGAITLAITIASFLLTLTYIGNSSNASTYPTQ